MREEDEKRRREKSKPCTLSFYNGYFRDYCWTEKVQLAVTFSLNPARYINIYSFPSPENSQSLDCEHARAVSLLLENL